MQSICFLLPTHYLDLLKDHLGLSWNGPKLSRVHLRLVEQKIEVLGFCGNLGLHTPFESLWNELFTQMDTMRWSGHQKTKCQQFSYSPSLWGIPLCVCTIFCHRDYYDTFICLQLYLFCELYVCKICTKLLPGVTPTNTLDSIFIFLTVVEALHLHQSYLVKGNNSNAYDRSNNMRNK